MLGTLFRRAATAAVAAALGAAGPAAAAGPATARLPAAPGTYIAVGDSVSAGTGSSTGGFVGRYCTYLEDAAIVGSCDNTAIGGETTTSALAAGGSVPAAIADIRASAGNDIVTVDIGGNDALGSGCTPVTASGCPIATNLRRILDELETALGTVPGPNRIQVMEYYNPDQGNPFGNAGAAPQIARELLGSDLALSSCTTTDLALIGLNDLIACIAREKGATPVDAYAPFQTGCSDDCFSDSLHPDDKGYGLIATAFESTPAAPVPATPPPDGTWPGSGGTGPGGGSGGPPPPPPAVISRVRVHGGAFWFRLSRPAVVTITVAYLRHGRLHTVATLHDAAHAGGNRVVFTRRVRRLPPRRYVAVLVARNAAGRSGAVAVRFRVRR
jgi:lysophospholipase L1-like esterase